MQYDRQPDSIAALTVHAPWSWLLANGSKQFETRSWGPPVRLVGSRLAIHVANRAAAPGTLDAETKVAMECALGVPVARWPELPRGAVLALGLLRGAYRVASWTPGSSHIVIGDSVPGSHPLTSVDLLPGEVYFGDYRPGRWLWWIADVEPLMAPVPARGHQRLWYWRLAAGA